MRVLPALAVLALAACGKGGSSSSPPPPPAVTKATMAITGVRVFDGDKVIEGADVAVDGDKIVAVGVGLTLPAGVEVVDGKGKTLLPGLIDAHAHVFEVAQLEQSLAFGVTTVLDMFSIPADVKKIKAEDKPDRAELRSAGTLATAPGGHGTEYGFEIPTIDKPADAQAFVDARFAEGSDYLKIVYDDGSGYDGTPSPSVDAATLRALIDAAHARKKLAVVHIGDYDEARTAIDAGADGLVHTFQDVAPPADYAGVVAKHGAFVTPTLSVLRTLQGGTSKLGDDPAIAPYLGPAEKANLVGSFRLRGKFTAGATSTTLTQLHAAKVPILVGTDAPNFGTTFGASVHDELAAVVEAGLPPNAALAGATTLPAQRYALPDRGRIAAGLRADLVLVDGDPTKTITDTRKIVAIWRGGVRFDRDAYKKKIDEAAQPAPAPAAVGPISDFEDGSLAVKFGQAWVLSTDEIFGGTSKGELKVVAGGANKSKHALAITGEVIGSPPATWSGAMFSPGTGEFQPADLSAKKQLTFAVKGDGTQGAVMVFAQRLGRIPAVRTFPTTGKFTTVTFSWADFNGLDGTDILAIFIGHADPGTYSLTVDDVALR